MEGSRIKQKYRLAFTLLGLHTLIHGPQSKHWAIFPPTQTTRPHHSFFFFPISHRIPEFSLFRTHATRSTPPLASASPPAAPAPTTTPPTHPPTRRRGCGCGRRETRAAEVAGREAGERASCCWVWNREEMSGAALCAALTELGFDGEDPLDADALEWPFQYEEARPLLAWICSCLRPSNVLSPSHLAQ